MRWLLLVVAAIACRHASSSQNETTQDVDNDAPTTKAAAAAAADDTIWYCSPGWEAYKDGAQSKCIHFSDSTTNILGMMGECSKLNAKPVEVLTRRKNRFLIDQVSQRSEEFMLPLIKNRGYGRRFQWVFSKLYAEDNFISDSIKDEANHYKEMCVFISGYSQDWDVDACSYNYNFICEKNVECPPGTFGQICESECHCAGEPCDSSSGQPTCKWGCEQGWTGDTCSRVKGQPEVRYFCIRSPEEHIGSYVGIHIYTKGNHYRSIYALKGNSTVRGTWCSGTTISDQTGVYEHVDITMQMNASVAEDIRQGNCVGQGNSTVRGTWCPGTTISDQTGVYEHVDITMQMNASVAEDIRQGNCVGQEIASGQFEWTLVIQEYEGILLDNDLQVVISCDFNSSETLQRSAQYERSDTQASPEKVELTPERADVTLEVVDPYTEQVITAAPVGSSAKLQIKFGYEAGSLVKGVCPHHCVAATPDGSVVKNLLDGHGCPNKESPIKPFSRDANSTTSISTVWFPLFAFAHHDQVEFKCSFDLCFNASDCNPGCTQHSHHAHRHRRAASRPDNSQAQRIGWMSRVIRILPEEPDQAETVAGNRAHGSKPQSASNSETSDRDTTDSQAQLNPRQPMGQSPKQPPTTAIPTLEYEIFTLLNPIICGLLLLLLVVFSVMFLVCHFSLRGTVENMRQDLLQRRAEERFLYGSPDFLREKDWVSE
ncbi:hypothetical protein PoB_004765000 [Plakobranchus ocellatus]|uniref:ZP domain-containing protein n=1 Tax=Plakobranchus ocellatus TaxID=259542 RepID=A0AAV4BKU8_9GAST|nr:hypothetical protein PoB_004765000 [Plakobranchus ocellatus]